MFFIILKERIVYYKNDGNPSHYKNVPVKKLHILKPTNKCADCTRQSSNNRQKEESGTCGGGGGNKAMDFSRRRVLACIACDIDRCNAIGTFYRNHVHNELIGGPHLAHSMDAKKITFLVLICLSYFSSVATKKWHLKREDY